MVSTNEGACIVRFFSMKNGEPIWRIAFTCDRSEAAIFGSTLDGLCAAVSEFEIVPGGAWRIEGLCLSPPDPAEVAARLALAAAGANTAAPSATIERLPHRDWLAENRRAFPPLRIGRYFVHGANWNGRLPAGAIALKLDAGMAFGSGEHATTRGCLIAIDWIARNRRRHRRMLDLGCGSGILALALARTWRRPVGATDNDRDAVRVAGENARTNGVVALVQPWLSNGAKHRVARRRAMRPPYDLIAANILAGPLCRLARDLVSALRPHGMLVLSGLLGEQEAEVLAVYRTRRMRLKRRIALENWHTLVLGR